jgi:hypothetical protein
MRECMDGEKPSSISGEVPCCGATILGQNCTHDRARAYYPLSAAILHSCIAVAALLALRRRAYVPMACVCVSCCALAVVACACGRAAVRMRPPGAASCGCAPRVAWHAARSMLCPRVRGGSLALVLCYAPGARGLRRAASGCQLLGIGAWRLVG